MGQSPGGKQLIGKRAHVIGWKFFATYASKQIANRYMQLMVANNFVQVC